MIYFLAIPTKHSIRYLMYLANYMKKQYFNYFDVDHTLIINFIHNLLFAL